MAQGTNRLLSYTVRQGDTLERIALNYMGDAANWIQLAILNKLDYPYISDDLAFVRKIKATGTVTFTRTAGSVGDVVIPAGSSVSVPAGTNAPARFYTTDALCTILNGTNSTDQTVTAVLVGEAGNAPAIAISTLNFTVANLASVRNANPITGGVILNVRLPGEALLVFVDPTSAAASIGVNTQALQGDQFYAALLGIDIGLDKTGDLQADSRGGLALVPGMQNLRDALKRRLQIPLAWYTYYPTYGTGIERAIGQRGETYWLQWAAVEAERTVRTDPRVASVANMKATYAHGVLALSFDCVAIGESNPQNLVINIATGGVR